MLLFASLQNGDLADLETHRLTVEIKISRSGVQALSVTRTFKKRLGICLLMYVNVRHRVQLYIIHEWRSLDVLSYVPENSGGICPSAARNPQLFSLFSFSLSLL